MNLKGLYHVDTAVLDQFCAELITQYLYQEMKYSCRVMKKISEHNIFGDFCRHGIKLEKVAPTFSSFNPC